MFQYSGEYIVAISKLGGHVVAFAGMDAFSALQSGEPPFDILRKTWVNSLICDVVVAVVMTLVLDLCRECREYMSHFSSDPKSLKMWLHECREADGEAASLILGLLLSATIRHAISGEHPPLHGGKPKSKSNDEVFLLFAVAMVLGFTVVRLELLLRRLLDLHVEDGQTGRPSSMFAEKHKKGISRVIRVFVDTVSMTMAWCLLYWGEWFIYNWTNDKGVGYGDRMSALLVVAAVLSGLCFAGIFVINFAVSQINSGTVHLTHGLYGLSIALGLVVGCAWEDVFIEAVGCMKQLNVLKLTTMNSTLLIISILCAVALPAWMFYIHPHVEHAKAHANAPEDTNSDEEEDT
jgi:hypothetical protein